VARLALRTGAPVIPIAIWGAQDVLPYGTSRPHLWPRKTIRMAAGPPVDLSAFQGLPLTATTLRNATAVVMADVTALLGDLRGGTPPAVPHDPDAAGKASISRTGPGESAATGDAGPAAGEDPGGGPEAEARPT
jgi:1-acyl-sn-glycerol-3-phosphate acyltransferase